MERDDIAWWTPDEFDNATPDERSAYMSYLKEQRWKNDPVTWGEERLGEQWWSKQREIARAVRRHRKVAVRACHDSGKSFTAARVACWWLDTGTPGKRFVISTAPTGDLVKAILWREINQAHKKGHLLGRTNLTEWYIGNEIVAMGRKPNDYEPNNFVGIHAPEGVLVIYDEAGGIPEALWRAGASMAANAASRELAIGNPDDPGSYFEKIFHPHRGWHPIHIDAFETPNFTGEEVAPQVAGSLVSHEYEEQMRNEYGIESPFYIAKVRGNFPKDRTDGIVPFSWGQACRAATSSARTGEVHLGVDVGAGGDETVVRERVGMRAGRTWRYRHDDAMQSVGEILDNIKETGATFVKVDVIGVGYGIHGRLKEVCEEQNIDCEVIGVNVGEKSSEPTRFVNLKAELWWNIARELSRARAWDLSEVDDQTVDEMCEHRYFKDSSGRVRVESKDDVKKRLGRSPDNADALVLSFYEPPSRQPVFLGAA